MSSGRSPDDARVRQFEIKGGPIEIRREHATGRVCLVFIAEDMQVKLFRTMSAEEWSEFLKLASAKGGAA